MQYTMWQLYYLYPSLLRPGRPRRLGGTSTNARNTNRNFHRVSALNRGHARFAHGGVGNPIFIRSYIFPFLKQYSPFQSIIIDSNDNPSSFKLHSPCPFPIFRNRSNAIRYLKRDDYFPATVSVRPYVDRLNMGSLIKDVTPGEGPEAFRSRGRFTVGYRSLHIIPRHTLSVSPSGSGSVIYYTPGLNPL